MIRKRMLAAVMICMLLCMMPCRRNRAEALSDEEKLSIRVALYTYFPNPESFQDIVQSAWEQEHPDVDLCFVPWNCYVTELPEDLDVFVFDSLYLDSYLNEDALLPIPKESIPNYEDLFPYAAEACTVDSELYAIPQFLCTYLLYSREGDAEMAEVDTIAELYRVFGGETQSSRQRSWNERVLFDEQDDISKICLYLQAVIDCEGYYRDSFSPLEEDSLSQKAIEALNMLVWLTDGAQEDPIMETADAGCSAALFGKGEGRAYIGFSEAMTYMGDAVSTVRFCPLALGGSEDVCVLYADLVGVSSRVADRKKDLAIELAALITGTDVMKAVLLPTQSFPYTQYFLSARESVYDALAESAPAFSKLKAIMSAPGNRLFRISPDGADYLKQAMPTVGLLPFSN